MNPIARMMKRYIKTPLKYALPLLFVGSLVLVSVAAPTAALTPTYTTITATPTAVPVGGFVTFYVTLYEYPYYSGLYTKHVTVYHYLNGVKYFDVTAATDSGGGFSFSQTFHSRGLRTYYAVFGGDNNYAKSTSSAVRVNVGTWKPTTASLFANNGWPNLNQKVTFTATLRGDGPLAGKPVTIYHYYKGVRYSDATRTTNIAGQVGFTTSFGSVGVRSYYAAFAGDSVYFSSTSNAVNINPVGKYTTTNLYASTYTPKAGQLVTFTIYFYDDPAPLSGEPVTVYHYLNGVRYSDGTRTTNAAGQITFTQSFSSAGTRYYYASFAGNGVYAASNSGSVAIDVGVTSITITANTEGGHAGIGQPVTFTATLKSGTTPLSGKSVNFYHYDENGYIVTDAIKTTNAAGTVSFVDSFESKGTYYLFASFAGDSSYQKAECDGATVYVGVWKSTNIILTVDNSTPAINQEFTFTATLLNGTTPLSGKYVDLQSYGMGVGHEPMLTDQYGRVTFTVRNGVAGTGYYYAKFAGDGTYFSSRSNTVTVSVE